MKTLRNIGLLTLVGALAFTLNPVTGLPQATAEESSQSAGKRNNSQVVKPTNKPAVINPYYLLVREENELVSLLKEANSNVSDISVNKGEVKLTFKDSSTETLQVSDLVTYKYRDGNGYESPEFPWIMNASTRLTENDWTSPLKYFRTDGCAGNGFTVRLENDTARFIEGGNKSQQTRDDIWVYANSVARLKLDAGLRPEVKIGGDNIGLVINDYEGWDYKTNDENNKAFSNTGGEKNKNPAPAVDVTDIPSKQYTFKVCPDPVPNNAKLGENTVSYNIVRASDNQGYAGKMGITIFPLAEKYEPQVKDVGKPNNPLVLNNASELTADEISSLLQFQYKDKPGTTLYTDRFLLTPTGTNFGLDASRLKAGEVQAVRVKVKYQDNQTGREYLKGNPDGDSVDYVDIYVKLPIPMTPLTSATPVPSTTPSSSPSAPGTKTDPNPAPKSDPEPAPKYSPQPYRSYDPSPEPTTEPTTKPEPELKTDPKPEPNPAPKGTEETAGKQFKITDPEPTPVQDPNNLTPEEKQKVREQVKKSNPNLGVDDDKIHVANNGEVTIILPDNTVVKIPPVKGVCEYAQPNDPTSQPNIVPSEANPVIDPRVLGDRELPRTGVDVAPVAWSAATMLLLGALLVLRSRTVARRRTRKH